MFGSLGIMELVAIFGVALLVFGPRKLPEIGRTLGKALGEFRKATDDFKSTIEREVRLEELKTIKTTSMESFITPVEAVSRTTPPLGSAGETVSVASPDGVADPSAVPVDEPATAAAALPTPASSSNDDVSIDDTAPRRSDDPTT